MRRKIRGFQPNSLKFTEIIASESWPTRRKVVPLPSISKNNNSLMVRQYETVFIVSPVLTEEQFGESADKYLKLLEDNGCELVNVERWGLRKLAYPIQKKSTGFYVLAEFKGEGEAVAKVELELKRDERILRFLTVKLDKYAVEFNERRRSKGLNVSPAEVV